MAHRNFIFVINNPDGQIFETIKTVGKGVAMQIEKGREGTIHIQGYVEFGVNTTFAQARLALGGRAHVEKRRGTREGAIEYSLKDDTRYGESYCNLSRVAQGKRTDILALKASIDEGMSMVDLWDNHFSSCLHYGRGVADYRLLKRSPSFRQVTVSVYLGETGLGKTRKAWEEYPELFDLLPPTRDSVWFDGYVGQNVLLIDEFYGNMPWGLLLRILDGHPVKLGTKHGVTTAGWTRVIITTNTHPNLWYNWNAKMQYNKLERRISEIRHFLPK